MHTPPHTPLTQAEVHMHAQVAREPQEGCRKERGWVKDLLSTGNWGPEERFHCGLSKSELNKGRMADKSRLLREETGEMKRERCRGSFWKIASEKVFLYWELRWAEGL